VAEYDLLNTNFSEDGFNKLKITIRVLGSLRQPKLILSSRPQLSQEDILSYLVLGAPLSQAGDNSAPLSQAALAFALKGGSQNVLNNIRKNLGLNQLSLGSITPSSPAASTKSATAGGSEDRGFQDNTAVFIGRAVSPNLYVSYGVGLFNAQQVVRTRLKIGRRWQFITESSNEGEGIDFIYIIERGD
jgi:translocation and assembly module TamB